MEEQIDRYNPILYNEPWECKVCTYHNEAIHTRCAMCDTHKNGVEYSGGGNGMPLVNPEEFKRLEDEMLEQMRGEWVCAKCAFTNPDEEEPLVMCLQCGFPRPDDNQCDEDFTITTGQV